MKKIAAFPLLFFLCAWNDVSFTDRMTDQKVRAFAVRSSHSAEFMGRPITADLVIRCEKSIMPGEPSAVVAYIGLSRKLAGYQPIGRYRFDQGETRTIGFSSNDEGSAIILSNQTEKDEFVPQLAGSSRLRVEIGIASGDAFFEFNTAGAKKLLADMPCKARR